MSLTQLCTQNNSEGEARKKALQGPTFKSNDWARTIDQHWNTHLAQWQVGKPIMDWWEQWKVDIYSVTSELEQLAHKKQHQTRDSLHAHMHMVATNAIENPTSKGATAMLTKAHKRINDWENQHTQAKRSQRVTYGVNIAEHLHPSYLNQTKEQKPKAKIPHLQRHEVHEYFPHLTPPIEGGGLEQQPSNTNTC